MKRLLPLLILLSAPAFAGERLLGVITTAGADTTNGNTAVPFFVPSSTKITIWCNAAGYVITDTTTAASATTALPLVANEKFPTSTSANVKFPTTQGTAAAGGAIVRIFGTAALTCFVYERSGTE